MAAATFGRALAVCREAAGLTQKDMAERAGLSASHVSMLESGKRDPSMQTIADLSKALGISAVILSALASDDSASFDDSIGSVLRARIQRAAREQLCTAGLTTPAETRAIESMDDSSAPAEIVESEILY